MTDAGNTTLNSELQSMLSDAGVGLWTYDGRRQCFMLDATCRALFDLEPDQSTSRDLLRERIHPDDLPAYLQAIRAALAEGGGFSIDYRIVHRDGSVHFISGRGRVHPRMPDDPILIQGVCIDITERRRLEQQLHATELQMRTLADSFPGLFCYVDREYVVRFLSYRYALHLGVRREELIGKKLEELTGRVKFLERKPLYDAVLAGEVHTFEEERPLADGGSYHYALTYNPDRSLSGEVRGFMAIGLDITELRRVERALKERSAELTRSNHDLEQFAYVASHDLKAPLRAIEVLVDWLREDLAGVETGEVQENLELLGQRTARLNRLLDDLLAYSRAGRGTGESGEIDSRQMVLDIATLLGPAPGMRIEADESLPRLHTLAAPLEQVLRNLINNAIKHHPTGQGVVRVWAERQDDGFLFAVEDDGAGIPQEFSEKVFQMFQTLRPRDEVEGSGMGLAIVKRLVESQGGRIWFKSGRGGRGTVFKFTWKPIPGVAPGQSRSDDPHTRIHSAG